jgi:radical SAM superfamily enzyme YgiQ (UPF0313 family)
MVSVLNLCHFEEIIPTAEILGKKIAETGTDAILTGGMSGHWNLIEDVLMAAKKIKPDIITIIGGPIMTADPNLAMENMPIDYGVIGEGEITSGELAEALQNVADPGGVNGLIYRRNGELVKTADRPAITDLDSLPFPDYEGFGYREWMTTMKYSDQNPILENYDLVNYSPIIGSRSCPYSCTFCYHPLGKQYRQRSLENIFLEIEHLASTYGSNFISFMDELFSIDTARMLELAERIKKYDIHWEACFRVNNVTADLLSKLKASKLNYMGFGVESLSDPILKSMKKMITKAEIENAFKLAREAGIFCSGNIILGDPAETEETIAESMDWWKKNPQYNLSLIFIKAIPDSEIYRYALEKKLIKNKLDHARNNFPIINLTQIPDKRFDEIKRKVLSYRLSLDNLVAGELLGSKKTDEKHGKQNFYQIKAKCPFCKQAHEYKRFLKSTNRRLAIFCKNCYSSFKLDQKYIFYDEFNLLKMLSNFYTGRLYANFLKLNLIKPDNQKLIFLKQKVKKILNRN